MPSDDNLESKVGKFKVNIKCTHRKANDFGYLYYNTEKVEINAYVCSSCLPEYNRVIEAYKNSDKLKYLNEDDDGFNENDWCFNDPE